MAGRRRPLAGGGEDLFSWQPEVFLAQRLAARPWPDPGRFPVNHGGARVRDTVWGDLVDSPDPLLVAGFSSIAELVDLLAQWGSRQPEGQARIVLGAEPFASQRRSFGSPAAGFTDEVRDYWLAQGVSLRLSAKLLQVRDLIEAGRVQVRFVDGNWRLHAKIYVGRDAATIGSSNFTGAGLGAQAEANIRCRRDREPADHRAAAAIAENYWEVGQPWDEQFAALLRDMLRVVTWQEALARACAALLTGEWAEKYLPAPHEQQQLWPTQIAGIAQALWVLENVGSVLVADATGSGKTRMGAHLVRSVQDRLVQSGRIRNGYTALVAPPGVARTWEAEAVDCGVAMKVVSHGMLSRGAEIEEGAVGRAQILALDESHNFLNRATARTRRVIGNVADHVLLFTATPISRGAKDLLTLVELLGADNFDDTTIDALLELERRPERRLDQQRLDRLRLELQTFTVRRTKDQLNRAVEADPEAFRDPVSGRVNRYPKHQSLTYDTAETAQDKQTAKAVRAQAQELLGVAFLGDRIERPVGSTDDRQALEARLQAARGLARHHVLNMMRSSRAALIDHVEGTAAAVAHEGIGDAGKSTDTGDLCGKVQRLALAGPPRVALDCDAPGWLTDEDQWRAACAAELAAYRRIGQLARQFSGQRERGKAHQIAELQAQHERIIVFDHSPITLAVIRPMVQQSGGRNVLLATGSNQQAKKAVGKALSRQATGPAIALCSDALNEGLNLQGASAIVHLDIPTTMRVAEQRVGRIDRMDSRYDLIESHWPADGEAFATRAAEMLQARAEMTRELIGGNLSLPDLQGTGAAEDALVDVQDRIAELHRPAATWDGIVDALDPVRSLVAGDDPLISAAVYRDHSRTRERVLSRVGPVRSASAWAFLAVAGIQHGAPRWILLEDSPRQESHHLGDVTARLRDLLAEDPAPARLDPDSEILLDRFLRRAEHLERSLLPRRMQRALDQMAAVTETWRTDAIGIGDDDTADRWQRLKEAAQGTGQPQPDPYGLAQRWFDLVKPRIDERRRHGRSRLVRLRDITAGLRTHPLDLDHVEQQMTGLPIVPDIGTRITACILGIPAGD